MRNALLWTIQILLAALFLFAAVMTISTGLGALVPFVAGSLAAYVGYGRWRVP